MVAWLPSTAEAATTPGRIQWAPSEWLVIFPHVASFNLTATRKFPEGTVVGAYPASQWRDQEATPSGAPPGAATASATVTNGVAAFVGLATGVRYWAGASVSGTWQYTEFIAGADTDAHADVVHTSDLAAAVAAYGTSGRELGYAQITANATSVTTDPTGTDVVGLSVAVTIGIRPVVVKFGCGGIFNTSTGQSLVSIYEGATRLAYGFNGSGVANVSCPAHVQARLAPAAGAHTYKIQLSRGSAVGTATISATADDPAFIQVIEC